MSYNSLSAAYYTSPTYYTPPASTSLFGGVPFPSSSPSTASSQGSIFLYQASSCSTPLSKSATPLILDTCWPMPIAGISAIKIASLPSCPDYGNALILVSNQVNCGNNTVGTGADTGLTGQCRFIEEEEGKAVDIKSVQFVCYGNGVANISDALPSVGEGMGSMGYRPSRVGVLGVVAFAILIGVF
jgi:hypothetical protein